MKTREKKFWSATVAVALVSLAGLYIAWLSIKTGFSSVITAVGVTVFLSPMSVSIIMASHGFTFEKTWRKKSGKSGAIVGGYSVAIGLVLLVLYGMFFV